MIQVNLSPQANADLEEIGDYIARDNPARALSFIGELKVKCLGLAKAARIGAPRPELGERVRMLTHGRYLIFYREHEATVRIERIMHSARDITSDDLTFDD